MSELTKKLKRLNMKAQGDILKAGFIIVEPSLELTVHLKDYAIAHKN